VTFVGPYSHSAEGEIRLRKFSIERPIRAVKSGLVSVKFSLGLHKVEKPGETGIDIHSPVIKIERSKRRADDIILNAAAGIAYAGGFE
jgi:hypothetical protein